MKNKDFHFINKWKLEMYDKLRIQFPNLSKEDIDKKLDALINTKFTDRPCQIDNNYIHKTAETTLLNLIEYIHKTNPILAGGGVLFKRQDEAPNASAGLLIESLTARNKIKAERKNFSADSYEFLIRDIGQGNEKVVANSYYGAAGAETSVFYNLYVAASTTGTGQALIATAETAFEALLAGNTRFLDLDECMLFMKRAMDSYIDELPIEPIADSMQEAIEKVHDNYMNRFYYELDSNQYSLYSNWISRFLSYLDINELTYLYYKNNLLELLIQPKEVRDLLTRLCSDTKSFKNPNKVPEEIVDNLNLLWSYVKKYCAHIHPVRSRIIRDSFHMRYATVTQDTDSTMVTIAKYMEAMIEHCIDNEIAAENENELDFILCNIMAYIITKYSQEILGKYCTDVNIPEEYHSRINMKNEFYNLMMILTPKKKRYVSHIQLQEGQMIDPPMVKVSGLDFIKSGTSSTVEKFFKTIIEENILTAEHIDVGAIIRKINTFKSMIRESLTNGELQYLNLISVKEPEAYKKPFSEQGIKGVMVWNAVYPNKAIALPDKVLVVKLDYKTLKKFEEAKELFGEAYDILLKEIFNSPNELISKPGITTICIPQNTDKLPDWVIRTMNVESMINDIVSKFNPILESLGNVTIKTKADSQHMSNIIDI